MAKYSDFKSYLETNYKQLIESSILKFINRTHDGIGFHSLNVLTVCNQKVDSIAIKYLSCHEELGDLIAMDATVSADIVTMGLGTKSYEADRKTKWFIVHMHGELNKGLRDVCVYRVEEYYDTEFVKEGALDEYMIPYIYTDDLEEEAEIFFQKYCEDAIYNMWQLPYGHIMRQMRIQALEAPLPDNVFGRMYFKPATAQYYYKFYPKFPEKLVEEEIPAGTMLINKQHYFMGDIGSALNTIAHELIHWDKHQKFFEILALLDDDYNKLSCEVMPALSDRELSGVHKALWWAEWQANTLAPRVLMPPRLFSEVFEDTYAEKAEYAFHDKGQVMEETIEAIGGLFGVSRFAAKTRAIQLGYDDADATLLYVNNEYFLPLSFKRGTLEKNQTFIIDQDSFDRICESDTIFAGLIESGLFVYAGCVICINHPLYVEENHDSFSKAEYKLTDYAKFNLDECCLIFQRSFRNDQGFDIEFYGQCYLSKEVVASVYCEAKAIDSKDNQDKKQRAIEMKKLVDEGSKIMEIYRKLPNSFSGTLDAHIKRSKAYSAYTGKPKKMTNIELASRTGLSEDYIATLRKEEKNVTLGTVCAICISLHLHPIFSKDLIRKSRNDFTLDDEGFFDQYLIENHYMDTLELCNEKLRELVYKIWGKEVA